MSEGRPEPATPEAVRLALGVVDQGQLTEDLEAWIAENEKEQESVEHHASILRKRLEDLRQQHDLYEMVLHATTDH